MIKVIKRDGRVAVYDSMRIAKATSKALLDIGRDEYVAKDISYKVANDVTDELQYLAEIRVEDIQDIVERVLETYDRQASTSYRKYRDERAGKREKARLLEIDKRILNSYSDRASNGNTDENTFEGKQGVIIEEEMEAIALAKMNPKHAKKHIDREIYIHDLNKYALGMHNCLVVDIEKLLQEGASVAQGDLRPTKRFAVAMQLIPVYIQIQSMNMFGGCATGHLDFIMQPYIERLIASKFKEAVEVIDRNKTDYQEQMTFNDVIYSEYSEFINDTVVRRVKEQIHQSCQALITNLVTLQTRGNQTPFSSINFGGNVSDEGKVFNKILLEELDRGIGRMGKTAIFPILCYYTEKNTNLYKGTKGFDITLYALDVQSRRHYPTFVNGNWSLIPYSDNHRLKHCRMGCRTGMTSDLNCNIEEERYSQVGRGNFAPHTICLPILAAKTVKNGGGLKEFYELLNADIESAKDSLLDRYELAKANPLSIAPTMFGSSYAIGTKEAKKPEDFLKHCTFAIGFVGLYECYEILTGKNFYDSEQDLNEAVNIVQTITNKTKEYTEKYHLNFSAYGTPAESLVTKVMDVLKRDYGYEYNREYVTNSFHVPVFETMSIFRKIDIESRFSELAAGGSIFHAEIDSASTNVTASLKILQYAMEHNIPYFRFSHKTSTCNQCGYSVEATMDKCTMCGSDNIEVLATITGYLTSTLRRMNRGKRDEVLHREILIRGNQE